MLSNATSKDSIPAIALPDQSPMPPQPQYWGQRIFEQIAAPSHRFVHCFLAICTWCKSSIFGWTSYTNIFGVLGLCEDEPCDYNDVDLESKALSRLSEIMQELGFTQGQTERSLEILKGVMGENIPRALASTMILFLKEGQSDSHRAWIKEELDDLMSQGRSYWEAVDQSVRIESFLVEALRLVPVVGHIDRSRLSNPGDRKFSVSIDRLARLPKLVGDEPLEFRRDRYLNRQVNHWPSHQFLPFGYGPHHCPAWFLYKATAKRFLGMLVTLFDEKRAQAL